MTLRALTPKGEPRCQADVTLEALEALAELVKGSHS